MSLRVNCHVLKDDRSYQIESRRNKSKEGAELRVIAQRISYDYKRRRPLQVKKSASNSERKKKRKKKTEERAPDSLPWRNPHLSL